MSAPFMQLYVADYLGDTRHLTTEQHGAYLLILMTMWRAGGRLPHDPKILARCAGVSNRRWHLLASEIMDLLTVDGDQVTQKRLDEEYKKAVSKSEKRSVSGKIGGRAKALKNNDAHVANASDLPQHSSDIRYQNTSSLRSEDAPAKPTPRSELEAVLDREHAAAVLEHRSKLRKPLTQHAAKLLAKEFAATSDPNAAADAMVANGWQGFKAEWLSRQSPSSAHSKPTTPKVDGWPLNWPEDACKRLWLRGSWPIGIGCPEPGQPGCKVPTEIQQQWQAEKAAQRSAA